MKQTITGMIKGLPLKFVFFIRKVKIQYRLLISFVLASLLPIMLVAFFSFMHSTNTLTSKISTYSQQLLEQIDRILNSEIMVYNNISDSFAMTELVQEGLADFENIDYSRRFEISREINDQAFIGNFSAFMGNISILRIYTPDNQMFYDLGYDEIKSDDWNTIRQLVDENGGYNIWTHLKTRNGINCIALCRRIMYSYDYSKQLGYILIGIDESKFSNKLFSDVNMGTGSEITVIDNDGQVMASSSLNLMRGQKYPDPSFALNILENEKRGIKVFQTLINEEKHLVPYVYNNYTKWYLTAAIPYSYINDEFVEFRSGILLIGGICLVFTIILTFIIYSSITVPLNKMVGMAGSIIEGDFSKRINDGASDEVGYLADKFDTAILKISTLIEKVKDEQVMKRKAEIRMLQAQINPHFLFNTLNSLRWTAMMSRAENVSGGIGALSEILKASIVDEKAEITLKEEIKNIENYLVIQKIRYGDVFEVKYDIQDEEYQCRVMKFMLQPIVENAIIHGFEGIDYQGVLRIMCCKEENTLKIEITDNGKGFDTNILENESKKNNRFSSIGISNIQERIRLSFGEQYGLLITSGIHKGTSVTVKIPYIIDEEGYLRV